MQWKRVYVLWSAQMKEPPSFDVFMGRKPVLTEQEKFDVLWEHIERDRKSAEPKITEAF